jgi:hypothetical protein
MFAAPFMGTAVVDSYRAESSGIKGMRILVHPSLFLSAPDLDEFLVPLPKSEQRPEAVGELNWYDLELRLTLHRHIRRIQKSAPAEAQIDLSRTAGAGRTPRRSLRSLHRARVPEAGDAEDPSPVSGLATIRSRGSVAVVRDVLARRLDLWPFGGRDSATEPPVPPTHRLDGPRCMGQEGGEAKSRQVSPRLRLPPQTFPHPWSLRERALDESVCAASLCHGEAIEAAPCAAVTVGVGVAAVEPTMP